jgi:hypothetical protein
MREKKEDRAGNEGGWVVFRWVHFPNRGGRTILCRYEKGKPKTDHIENLQDSRAKPPMGFDIKCGVL